MKIIDLLNKIINREKLPKKIIYKDKEFYLCNPADKKEIPYYMNNYDNLMNHIDCFYKLNDEVKIIDKKQILHYDKNEIINIKDICDYLEIMSNKINEIIEKLD